MSLLLCALFVIATMSSCKTFEDWCITTPDGFTYYYNEGSKEGAYILEIPDDEEVVIPEYVDGKKVVELGHLDMGIGTMEKYYIVGTNTKKLTIQHQFHIRKVGPIETYVNFPNLTNLTFIDFLYCNQTASEDEIIVPHYIGKKSSNVPIVELRKSDREFSLEDFKPKVILIPEYVEIIESGVFEGLTDVIIKTSYESKPEGWQEGWNGTCEVQWGEKITYLSFQDYFKTTEDGFKYYYDEETNEGVYIVGIPDYEELIIPEYIDGKKVVELGHIQGGARYGIYGTNTKTLTIQHQISVCSEIKGGTQKNYVCFRYLTNLVFIDFLYCNSSIAQEEITVPCCVGEEDYYNSDIPIVELRKSNREFSLEDFKPKVINIPEYVEIIEAGVFAGLTDVTIKTSYESKPEGWEDGWNGTCKVEWGVQLK